MKKNDFAPLLLVDPVQAGKDLLGGFLAGVDDVLGLLETFVEGRVVEHAVILFEHRQHRLAGRRGPAAHDRRDLVVDEKLLGLFREGRPIAGAVFLDDLDLAAEDAAGFVDLRDGELFGLDRAGFRNRHGAGGRMQDAAGDFSIGNRETCGVDRGGCRRVCKRWARKHGQGGDRRHSHQQLCGEMPTAVPVYSRLTYQPHSCSSTRYWRRKDC